MNNWGLLLLGIIQIGTALMVFNSANKTSLFGMTTLPVSLSLYRYMLTTLWLSVGAVYVVGAFNYFIAPGAVLLGAVNAALETFGYWLSVRGGLMPGWYAALSTGGVGGAAALSVYSMSVG